MMENNGRTDIFHTFASLLCERESSSNERRISCINEKTTRLLSLLKTDVLLLENISATARTNMLKILLPRILPIPISLLPIITEETVTASSGSEVDQARKRAPEAVAPKLVTLLILSTTTER
jgi:hypothetical protein